MRGPVAEMASRPLVSVIVVNHNRAKLLCKCIASLLHQSYREIEIIVVDNSSTDESCTMVRSLSDERIRLVRLPENRGFAGGCNAGLKEARGELLALLNNDAEAEKDWLASLVEQMRTDRSVGMCASKILLHGSGIIDKAGHLMYPDGQNRGRGTGEPDVGQYDRVEETFFPDGCAALYRLSAVREVGGFDEEFFAYADDADLGIRLRWSGWTCSYVPEARVHHHHSATSGRHSPQRIYWIERNRVWLAVKNFPLPLLLLSPVFTVYRWGWNLVAALSGHGAAGRFRDEQSVLTLVVAIVKAYLNAVKGLRGMWRKRGRIRRNRRITEREFYGLIWRFRISARVLSWQDRD